MTAQIIPFPNCAVTYSEIPQEAIISPPVEVVKLARIHKNATFRIGSKVKVLMPFSGIGTILDVDVCYETETITRYLVGFPTFRTFLRESEMIALKEEQSA
jgi:hypothetical protein